MKKHLNLKSHQLRGRNGKYVPFCVYMFTRPVYLFALKFFIVRVLFTKNVLNINSKSFRHAHCHRRPLDKKKKQANEQASERELDRERIMIMAFMNQETVKIFKWMRNRRKKITLRTREQTSFRK